MPEPLEKGLTRHQDTRKGPVRPTVTADRRGKQPKAGPWGRSIHSINLRRQRRKNRAELGRGAPSARRGARCVSTVWGAWCPRSSGRRHRLNSLVHQGGLTARTFRRRKPGKLTPRLKKQHQLHVRSSRRQAQGGRRPWLRGALPAQHGALPAEEGRGASRAAGLATHQKPIASHQAGSGRPKSRLNQEHLTKCHIPM